MKTGVIFNPVCGGGQVLPLVGRYEAALRQHFPDFEIRMTEHAGHARDLAADFTRRGFGLVIAAGGDGTLGEVLGGLLADPAAAPPQMAILPHGTCNDYARSFASPPTPEARIAAIAAASPRPVDVGCISCTAPDGSRIDRHFINVASVGLSGNVARAINGSPLKSRFPALTIFLHSFLEVLRFKPPLLRVTVDGEAFALPSPLVVVANSPRFGGGLKIAPAADLHDGKFEVVMIRASSRWQMLAMLVAIYAGRHAGHRNVQIRRAGEVVVELAAFEPGLFESDGEAPGNAPWYFRSLPDGINLRV